MRKERFFTVKALSVLLAASLALAADAEAASQRVRFQDILTQALEHSNDVPPAENAHFSQREADLSKREADLNARSKTIEAKEQALMSVAVAEAADAAVPDVGSSAVVVRTELGLMNWTENYIEATGMSAAPGGSAGAQAKALARRGATLDLQRNLLEFMKGVQVSSETTMNDFMAEDVVKSQISGVIKNVEITKGEWDGESFTVTGRMKIPAVRAAIGKKIPVDKSCKEPEQQKKGGRFTGLVIDVRHLPLVPAMGFRVFDEGGKPVYGMEFVDYDRYLQSGLCVYHNNINYAKGEAHVAGNPIVTKAVKLKNDNVDIVIPNAAAAQVRGSSCNFRRECRVIVVTKQAGHEKTR